MFAFVCTHSTGTYEWKVQKWSKKKKYRIITNNFFLSCYWLMLFGQRCSLMQFSIYLRNFFSFFFFFGNNTAAFGENKIKTKPLIFILIKPPNYSAAKSLKSLKGLCAAITKRIPRNNRFVLCFCKAIDLVSVNEINKLVKLKRK